MIDSATGVKVRLRLGVHSDQDGEKLAIFYKLFTSRPVIDLCASSPRQDSFTIRPFFIIFRESQLMFALKLSQYTHANSKQPKFIHTKNNINLELPPEKLYQRNHFQLNFIIFI